MNANKADRQIKKQIADAEADAVAASVREWMDSDEGIEMLEGLLHQSSEMILELRKAGYVGPNTLQEAITI